MATISEALASAVQYHQAGRLQEAAALYQQVLRADPTHAEAHHLLGVLAFQAGQPRDAIALIRQALVLNPNHVDAHNNLGNVLGQQEQFAEAAACFRQALRLDPAHASAHYNLGTALVRLRQLEPAIEHFQQALLLNPDYADTHNNLGNALLSQGSLIEATACFRQAARLSPRRADIQRNLGIALASQGYLDEAAQCYELALRVDPGHRLSRLNRALLHLLQGDFAAGWPHYEERWAQAGLQPRSFHQPRWLGAPLAGQAILVYADEALGDTIQFARFLPLVRQRGGRVIFECQPDLVALFADFQGIDQLVTGGAALPHFDVQVPLLALPGIFNTTLANIPAPAAYLRADQAKAAFWRQELSGLKEFKVGIVWQGNPNFIGDQLRSIPLRYFEPLTQFARVRLLSLQKGEGAAQLAGWRAGGDIIDLGPRLTTFSDTAAVLANLDLLISSDTSVPHLAGALGLPVWTVLQRVPDWRWLLDRADSPWYPTMRLFRQKNPGAWDEVFDRVTAELVKRLAVR